MHMKKRSIPGFTRGAWRTAIVASVMLCLALSYVVAADPPKPAEAKPAPATAPAPTSWEFTAQELAMPQGKPAASIPEDMRRMFKIVDDPDAKGGKALQVTVDKRIIREDDVVIFRTPPIPREQAPVGLYRATVRLKMSGMLNVIGTSIRLATTELPDKKTRSNTERYWEPTIHGFMFKEADVYQEFSIVTEVIEPDHVSQRPIRPAMRNALGQTPPSKPEMEKAKLKGPPDPKVEEQKLKHQAQLVSNFEKGTLSVNLSLLQAITKGFGRSRNSIQALTIDRVKIERLPAPATATVRQVLPQKILVKPGESQEFHVWVHNRSGKPQTGELHLQLTHGLGTELEVARQPLTIESGKYAVIDVPWTAPKQDLWGCAVTAEFVQGGKAVSSAEEYFSVHTNPWAVMNFGGSNRSPNPYYKFPDYRNYCEFFGVTPGDSVQVFPEDPSLPYFSGMSNYMTHIELQKQIVDHNRAIGIPTFMYLSPLATSHLAQAAYEKHPEWFGGRINWTDLANDLWVNFTKDMIARWTAGKPYPDGRSPEAYHFYHIETAINDFFDDVYKQKLDGTLKSMKFIGYDGIRWDGDPFTVFSGSFAGQTFGTGSSEGDQRLVAKRIEDFKTAVRKEFPHYTEGANGVMGSLGAKSYSRKLSPPPPIETNLQFMAFLKDGSSIMDEGWMNAYMFNDPRNNIKDYFWGCRQQTDLCRRAGGFLHTFSPQRDGTPYFAQSIIYYTHLVALAGAQYPGMWSCGQGSESGLAQFLTRYSEFLWDNKLMWVQDAAKQIRVESPTDLWWDETVVARDLPDGRHRMVIPLVNPPTVDRFLRDQFSELAEPIREPFAVEVKVPTGYKTAKVYMLSDEPRTACTSLKTTVEAGVARFEVPELILFRVIVVEFEK